MTDPVSIETVHQVRIDLPLPLLSDFGTPAVSVDSTDFVAVATEIGIDHVESHCCPASAGVYCETTSSSNAAAIAAEWRRMAADIPPENWTAQVSDR